MSRRSLHALWIQIFVIIGFYWSCQGQHISGSDQGLDTGEGESTDDPEITATSAKPVVGGSAKILRPGEGSEGLGLNYFRTPLSGYVFPVLAGSFGSAWCTCRTIGTSPHIGQDIIDQGQGQQRSVAMSNGQIVGMSFDSACGWRVQFKDSMGSIWHYLHLNKPLVSESQIVARGTVIGVNSDYPKAGCGSGPHLHLERRSPGAYGSPEEFRTCQFGASTCYYNPRAPIENAILLKSETERTQAVASSQIGGSASSSMALDGAADSTRDGAMRQSFDLELVPKVERELEARPLPMSPPPSCQLKIQGREDNVLESLGALRASSDLVVTDLAVPAHARESSDPGSHAFRFALSFGIELRGNPENQCQTAEGSSRDCIVSWNAYEKRAHGFVALMGGVGSAGQPIAVTPEQGLCLSPSETKGARENPRSSDLWVVVETRQGHKLMARATLKP